MRLKPGQARAADTAFRDLGCIMADGLTIAAAFVAGLLSFASPCVLPILPGFLTYLGGIGLKEGMKASKGRIFLNAIAYVLGFSFVFSLLGVLLNGVLSNLTADATTWLSRLGGTIIIIFGLYVIGLIKFDFLQTEHRLKPGQHSKYPYFFSFLFGASFAVGWSPCVGAILGAVLTLAATMPGQSFTLLWAYSLGLGIPFLLAGAFVAEARELIRHSAPIMQYVNIVSGVLLIILGIMVFTLTLSSIANFGLAQFALGGN